MDISPAGPWTTPLLVVGIVLAVVVLAAVGILLVLRRNGRLPGAAGAGRGPGPGEDDLPGFLEFPPGSTRDPVPPSVGWPALSADPSPSPSAGRPTRAARRRTVGVLGAAVLAALLVLAVLAALDRSRRPGPDRTGGHADGATAALPTVPATPAPGDPGAGQLADATVRPGRDGGSARLAFGGLVLEQRAVGVTATYPVVEATWDRDGGIAHLRLPTFNCLTTTAPEDPVAAGCAPSVPEYADLATPALTVTGDDGTVELSGRFPTYVQPNGSPAEWTGRSYEVRLRAAPVDGARGEGRVRAEGEIRLGSGRAPTLDTSEVTVLRRN